MQKHPNIIFVCEHGAAKSIIAAAYFNKFAIERGMKLRALARGTNPDNELSAKAVMGLHEDGLSPSEAIPQKLSLEDLESAPRIVSFCVLPEEFHEKAVVEHWANIPPVSEEYEKSRDAILVQIHQLIENLR